MMPTYRISWDTPNGEQSDWIEANDMRAALSEAKNREWMARPMSEAERRLQDHLNWMRGEGLQQISMRNAAKLIAGHHSLSKALLGFDL